MASLSMYTSHAADYSEFLLGVFPFLVCCSAIQSLCLFLYVGDPQSKFVRVLICLLCPCLSVFSFFVVGVCSRSFLRLSAVPGFCCLRLDETGGYLAAPALLFLVDCYTRSDVQKTDK